MSDINGTLTRSSQFAIATGTTSSSRQTLLEGQTISWTFTNIYNSESCTVSNFSANVWTNTSNLTIDDGFVSSPDKVVKTSPTLGDGTLSISSGSASGTFYYTVVSNTPDQFTFTDVTGASTGTEYDTFVQITGISSTANVSITGSGTFAISGSTTTPNSGNFDTSNKTIQNNQYVHVKMTSSASSGATVSTTINVEGVTDDWDITTVDDVPDSFDLGADLTNVAKSQEFVALNKVTVAGLDAGVTISADVDRTAGTGTVEFKRTGDTQWRDTAYVYSDVDNGDEFSVRITTPNADNATTTARLDIGVENDIWSVTTQDNAVPSGSVEIASGLTLPISQRDMMDFFGGDDSTYPNRADNLTAYNRGGSYVPDITTNTTCGWDSTGINTSAPIELRSFVGSATTFFMSDNPTNLSDVEVAYSGGGPWVLAVQWDVGDPTSPASEWAVGYGPGMWSKAEYKYAVTNLNAEGTGTSTGDILITSGSSPYTTYDPGNTFIRFEVSSSNANTQKLYSGTVTFYARHVDFPGTTEVSATANFSLNYLSNE